MGIMCELTDTATGSLQPGEWGDPTFGKPNTTLPQAACEACTFLTAALPF